MATTGYTTRDVARLLKLSPGQVRAYVHAGFIAPARGPGGAFQFSFQDLVLLRIAKGLRGARFSARRVRAALVRLRRQLPEGRALSEVRIAADGDRLVVRDGRTAWSPESGQLLMDFEVSELAHKVAPLARRAAAAARRDEEAYQAEDWYELGVDLEVSDPSEARDAYRRAIELDPHHVDARVNLGRLLHEAGQARAAEAHYRMALSARPDDAVPAFNLGVALEDLARPDEAIRFYERAVRQDPAFADAWYNLAGLYERRGRKAAALRALKTYRSLVRERDE